MPSQDIDEGQLGILSPVEGAEQNGALDFDIDGIAPHRLMRELIVKLPQPGFLSQAGSPVAIAAGNVSHESRVLFHVLCFGPVAMRRFDANGFQWYHHLMLIRLYPGPAWSPVAIGISKYFPSTLRNIAKQISSPHAPGLRLRQDFV